MLPSARAQKPVVIGPSWASDVTLAAIMIESSTADFDPGGLSTLSPAACQPPSITAAQTAICLPKAAAGQTTHGTIVMDLWCQPGRKRRVFTHQGNGHPSVRRERGVVGKQRLGVSLAGDSENVRRRQPFPLEDLADGIGPVGREVEGAIVAPGRHVACGRVTGDRNP